MIHKIFSVYDKAAKAYLPPFFMHEEAMAQRAFSGQASDSSTQVGRFPQDYVLMRLGEWDDQTGLFDPEEHGPVSLGLALEYVKYDPDANQLRLLKSLEDEDEA